MSSLVASYPLHWPVTHPRTAPSRRRSALFQVDFIDARDHLMIELERLNARRVVISTDIPVKPGRLLAPAEPLDPGAAVYFERVTNGGPAKPYVIACDQFLKLRWNLRAIGKTIEALRAIERHATTSMLEQAFSGFAQLHAPGGKPWRDVLGFEYAWPPSAAPREAVRAAIVTRFHELARLHHPDVGGDTGRMAEINAAFEAAIAECT